MDDRQRGVSVGAIVGGAILIAIGGWLLLGKVVPFMPEYVARAIRIVTLAIGPLALIGLGILVIVAANRGAFSQAPDVAGKRWYRSRADRMISGVLGGLGAYLDVDPTLLRIGYVLLSLVTGLWLGAVAYLVASVVVPEAPVDTTAAPGQQAG